MRSDTPRQESNRTEIGSSKRLTTIFAVAMAIVMVLSMMAPAVAAGPAPTGDDPTTDSPSADTTAADTETATAVQNVGGDESDDGESGPAALSDDSITETASTTTTGETDDYAHTITLVTGETIHLAEADDGWTVSTEEKTTLHVVEAANSTYVYPDGVDFSVYDRALFDVDILIEEGLTDAESDGIPLIIDVDTTRSSGVGAMSEISGLANARSIGLTQTNAATIDKAESGAALDQLDREHGLESVHLDQTVEIALDSSVEAISGKQAQQQYGVNGSGVTVAVLDTGVDADHPDLADAVVDQADFSGDGIGDSNGHGTHVAGTIAGDGTVDENVTGVAPGADIMDVKVLGDDGGGDLSDIINGTEYAVNNDADVISMSLGGPGSPNNPLVQEVEAATDEGVVVVSAAGNAGPDRETIGMPAKTEAGIAVGATDHREDEVASFSSRGPTISERLVKPDVVAPGVDISAANAGADADSDAYQELSGTSMAAPHVSGLVAMILEAEPETTPDETKDALVSTSDRVSGPDDSVYDKGAGQVNATRAVASDVHITNATTSSGLITSGEQLEQVVTLENRGNDTVELLLEETLTEVTSDEYAGGHLSVNESSITLAAGEQADVSYTVNTTDADPGVYSGRLNYFENETTNRYGAMFGYTIGTEVTVEKSAFSDDGSVEEDTVWAVSDTDLIERDLENGQATFLATDEEYVIHSPGYDAPTNQPIKTVDWLNTSETDHVTLDEGNTVPVTMNDSAFDDGVRSVQLMPKTEMDSELEVNPTWTGLYDDLNAKTMRFTSDSRLNASVAHAFAPTDQHDTGSNLDADDVYYHVHHVLPVDGDEEYAVTPDGFATINTTYARTAVGESHALHLHSHSNRFDDGGSSSSGWHVGDRTEQRVHINGTAGITVNGITDFGVHWQLDSYENPSAGETFDAEFQRLPHTGHIDTQIESDVIDVRGSFMTDQPPHRLTYGAWDVDDNPYAIAIDDEIEAEGADSHRFSERIDDVDLEDGDTVAIEMFGANPEGVLSTGTGTGAHVTYEEGGDNTPPMLEGVDIDGLDEYNSVESENVTVELLVDSSDGVNESATHLLTAAGDVDSSSFDGEEVNPNGTWTEHDVNVTAGSDGSGFLITATIDTSEYDGAPQLATVIRDTGADTYVTETRNAFHVGDVPVLQDSAGGGAPVGTENITAQLVQSDGDPAADHTVVTNRRDTDTFTYNIVETDDDGVFTAEVEDGGVYDLTVFQSRFDGQGYPFDGNAHIQNLATVDLSDDDADTSASDIESTDDGPSQLEGFIGTGDSTETAQVETDDPNLGTIDLSAGHQLVVEVENQDGEPVRDAEVVYRDNASDEFFGTAFVIRTGADGLPYIQDSFGGGGEPGMEMNGSTDITVRPSPDARFKPVEYEQTLTVENETNITVTLEDRDTVTVGDSEHANFTSISDAVNSTDDVPDHSLIVVENGTYEEQVIVDRPLAFISEAAYESSDNTPGAPADTAVLDGNSSLDAAFVVENGVNDVFVEGFHIRNYTVGLGTDNGNTTNVGITGNTIEGVETGVLAERPDDAARNEEWYVRQNVIDEPAGSAIELVDTRFSVVLDNVIHGDGDAWTDENETETDVTAFDGVSTETTSDAGTEVGIIVGAAGDTNNHDAYIENNRLTGSYNDSGIAAIAIDDAVLPGPQIRDNDLGDAEFQGAGIFVGADDAGAIRGATVENNNVSGAGVGAVTVLPLASSSTVQHVDVVNNELADSEAGVAVVAGETDGFVGDIYIADNDISADTVGVLAAGERDMGWVEAERNQISDAEFGIGVETPFEPTEEFNVGIGASENLIENTQIGVGVGGENAYANVEESELVGNDQGIVSAGGAGINVGNSTVSDNHVGLNATNGSYISAYQTELAGNEQGATSTDGADLFVDTSTVSNNTVGLNVTNGSYISAHQTELAGNEQGVVSNDGAFGFVENSTVSNNTDGLTATNGSHINAWQSDIVGNEKGVTSIGGADIFVDTSTVSNNTVGLTATNGSHINAWQSDIVDNEEGATSTDGAELLVETSTVSNNTVGLTASDEAHITARQSEIVGNAEFGALIPDGNATIEAASNWWGAASGPSGSVADPSTGTTADGAGDNVSQNVTFDPWLEGPLVTASGTVFRPDTDPAAGVVSVLTQNGGDGAELDEEGRFVVAVENNSQPAVGYQRQAQGEAISTRDGIADLHTFSSDSVIEGDTDLGNFTIPEAHVLNVTVADENGDPVEDAQVRILHWEDTHNDGYFFGTGEQETNAEGEFVLPGAEHPGLEITGNVTVEVTPPNDSSRFVTDMITRNITVTESRSETVTLAEDSDDGSDGGDDGGDDGGEQDPVVEAQINASSTAVTINETVTFNGSASEGDALNYAWEFGDGTNATGETVTHEYGALGTYNVTLTVTDADGNVATDELEILVSEELTAVIEPERTTATVGDLIEFDGGNSTGNIQEYQWDFGDGENVTTNESINAHEYTSPGTYTVELTVVDESGETATATVDVTIESETDDDTPGFGPVAGIIALLAAVLVARVRGDT